MKRIFLIIAALAATLQLSAQTRGQSQSNYCEAYLEEPQGSYMPSFKVDGKEIKVKNVILMIGDGMGPNTVSGAMLLNGKSLTMTNLHSIGFVRTQSANNFSTDSAASGSAYACGQKTNNGFLGVDTARVAMANLPEKLSPLGYACGIVSTDDLHGATPAAFFAHQGARGAKDEIWKDLPSSALTFFSAGTRFIFESQPLSTQEAIRSKFSVIYDPDDVLLQTSKRLGYLPETTGDDRGDYLPRTTRMAIDYLSARSKKGFFLMVEGAHIDHKAHGNDADGLMKETLDFDKAVEVAVRFADQDGHTLVIISADHETGSVALLKSAPEDGQMRILFGTKSHSGVMVPLFAYGPKSRRFCCVQENSDVSNKIFEILSGK